MTVSYTESAYDLTDIQSKIKNVDALRMTGSARIDCVSMGFSDQEVVDLIQDLQKKDFYKSMPPKAEGFTKNHDVYKTTFQGQKVYIKFQVIRGYMVVSCKPDTST